MFGWLGLTADLCCDSDTATGSCTYRPGPAGHGRPDPAGGTWTTRRERDEAAEEATTSQAKTYVAERTTSCRAYR